MAKHLVRSRHWKGLVESCESRSSNGGERKGVFLGVFLVQRQLNLVVPVVSLPLPLGK